MRKREHEIGALMYNCGWKGSKSTQHKSNPPYRVALGELLELVAGHADLLIVIADNTGDTAGHLGGCIARAWECICVRE